MARRKPRPSSRSQHFLNVISSGPLIIAKVPWPMPKWRDILKALTRLMQSHGLKKKDITAVEGLTYFDPDATEDEIAWYPKALAKDAELLDRLDMAFAGDPSILPKFWLYSWSDGEFAVTRSPAEP